tara:strand:- start:344 stop:1714 length:1371 start_codon:yes stop_codon:yes gene_type:complete
MQNISEEEMMKKNRLILTIIFMVGFLFPVGEAGAVFLLIAPGAAAQGTGEANVARVNDAYASYYNPASLAFQSKTSIVGMHVNWLKTLVPDLYYEFIGFASPGYGGTIGGHLIFLSLGEQLATDADGNELGNFKSYMWALDASYGTKLTKNSGVGIGFKLFHQKLADSVTENESGEGKPYSTDFAFDLAYLLKQDKFSFGFNIANIGPPISFIDEDQADPAPTNMRLGFFGNLYEDEFIKFNMLMDMQKLLVASYPSMDWDGDRMIGDGINGNSNTNGDGQNEAAYFDPWYKAWATAWLDDWYYGGDVDYDGDRYIGGYSWTDGENGGEPNGIPEPEELFWDGEGEYGCQDCSDPEDDGIFELDVGEVKKELGSRDDRTFSKEFKEVIFNTGFEFWYTESFVLRFGYIYDKEGDITNPTFGAGVRFDGYGFDFGYTAGEQGHPRSNTLFFSLSAEI